MLIRLTIKDSPEKFLDDQNLNEEEVVPVIEKIVKNIYISMGSIDSYQILQFNILSSSKDGARKLRNPGYKFHFRWESIITVAVTLISVQLVVNTSEWVVFVSQTLATQTSSDPCLLNRYTFLYVFIY